ncbi:MAG: hypothetical protein ABFD07_01530 [Methanobacterium sp.]
MVTDKVTTVIDLEIKLAFELTKSEHHKGYKEALEMGALAIIAEVDPVKASQLRIQKMEQMLAEERQALANYELIKQVKKPEVKKEDDNELDKIRDVKYQENLRMLKFQAKKPHLFDWSTLQGVFRFKTKAETEDYVKGRLKADGYM